MTDRQTERDRHRNREISNNNNKNNKNKQTNKNYFDYVKSEAFCFSLFTIIPAPTATCHSIVNKQENGCTQGMVAVTTQKHIGKDNK